MIRKLFVIAGVLALALAAVALFTGFGFAQATGPGEGGYGEPGEGTGPGLEHRYGPDTGSQEEAASVATDDDDCCGTGPAGPQTPCEGGHGEPGEGTGPGLEHHYGPGVD